MPRAMPNPLNRAVRLALFGAALCTLTTLTLAPRQAMAEAAVVQYNIPAGPLGTALSLFATQARITLSFNVSQTQGMSARGLVGSFGTEDGLARLLAGSGLAAQRQGNGSYVLVAVASAGSLELGATNIDSARDNEASEGTGAYTAPPSRTATKLPLSIRETPQSVTVITRQQMDDHAAPPSATCCVTPRGCQPRPMTVTAWNIPAVAWRSPTTSTTA
jgi:outer membrane receptor for ferric coprogen and ferric-rhodotorulic acid